MKCYCFYKFIFGILQICYEYDKIIEIKKVSETCYEETNSKFTNNIFKQLDEYFLGYRKEFNLPFILNGTDFQKKVWFEIIKIPYGKTVSYKDIAISINKPKAYRAVGSALNKNPIAIVVPCHRVVGSNKKLVGYAYGLDMKNKLLDLEYSNNL